MSSQFVVIPPLKLVEKIFQCCTEKPLEAGVTWIQINEPDAQSMQIIRKYIRNSHAKLWEQFAQGFGALAFLRQILRPHGFSIKKAEPGYKLILLAANETVIIRSGQTIEWN